MIGSSRQKQCLNIQKGQDGLCQVVQEPQHFPNHPQPLDPGFQSTGMKKCSTASLLWGSPQNQQELEAQVAELHLLMLNLQP